MIKHKISIYILFLGSFFSAYAVISESEFNQLNHIQYHLESKHILLTTSLNSLTDSVQSFPESQKNTLLSNIQEVQTQIDVLYNETLKKLQTQIIQARQSISKKSGVAQEVELTNQISNLDALVKPVTTKMTIAVSQVYNSVQQLAAQLDLSQKIQKAQETQQKQKEYHQRVLALLKNLQPVISNFSQQSDAIRNAIVKQVKTGSVDETTVSTITNNSQVLIKQAEEIYKNNNFPILVADTSNYVVASFAQLARYYTNEMAITVDAINVLLADPRKQESSFAPLAQLGLRILGTKNSQIDDAVSRLPSTMSSVTTDVFKQGYNTVIKTMALKYFQNEALTIMKDYRNTKQRVTFNVFVNALEQLTNLSPEPTSEQVGYAIIYYTVIVDNFDVVSPELTQDWQRQIAVKLAVFFVARAQAVIKNMQPDQDTTVLLQDAINSYNQASNYYTLAGGDQNIGLSKTYKALSSLLLSAQKKFQQAVQQEKSNNIDTALNAYQEAAAEFKQAGDAVDATQANFNMQKLSALQEQKEGQKILQNYLATSRAEFADYMSFISTSSGQKIDKFDTYASLYTSLQQAFTTCLQNYTTAKNFYELLSTTQRGQKVVGDQLVLLNNTILWLISMNSALQALENGDNKLRQVQDASSTDAMFTAINAAQDFYTSALVAFGNADSLYKQYPTIQPYILVLPADIAQNNTNLQNTLAKNQDWIWSTIAYRHIAALYIAVAAQVEGDITVVMQCYSNANTKSRLLSSDMNSFLQTTIQNLKMQKASVDKLFQQAQQNEQQALLLTIQDWAPDQASSKYTSKASLLWQSTINTYAHAYNLGNVQAKDAVLRAINEYSKAYKAANIPEQYNPNLDLALIKYASYVFYLSLGDTQNSSQVLSDIKPLIGNVFDVGSSLQQNIRSVLQQESSLDALLTASTNQEQFIAWHDHLTQVTENQQTIVSAFVPGADLTKFQLLTKTEKNDSITYTFALGSRSITFTNPLVTLAQLNAQIGTKAFNEQDYITAYNAYMAANKLYEDQGKDVEAQALSTQLSLSRTLATAQQFRDFVLPSRQEARAIPFIKVATIPVPQRYELKIYQQPYPLPVQAGFDALASQATQAEKEQVQNELLGMAALLYLYNVLQANGLNLLDVIAMDTMSPKANLSSSDLQTVQNAVAQTKVFQSDLKNRIDTKISSLYVTKKGGSYFLGEVYKPIAAIPPTDEQGNSLLPYITYPYATYYYLGAYNLFKPSKTSVNIGGNVYVPGNNVQAAKDVLALIANANLSAGAASASLISDATSDIAKALNSVKAIKPQDTTVAVSDYMDKYTYIKNYYTNLVLLQYDTAYTYYDKYLNNRQYTSNLAIFLGDTYVQFAQALSLFLFGNPLDANYSTTVLPDIENLYKTAANYYNTAEKTKNLYQIIAQLYTNAGKQIVKDGNFIYALGFLYRAEQIYKNIPSSDVQTQELLENATLLKIQTMFYGSTQKLEGYANKLFAGQPYFATQQTRPLISLTLSTGKKVQEEFSELQQKYQTAGAGDINQTDIDSVELAEYSDINSLILDGLIFYSAASSSAANELPAPSQQQNTADNHTDPVTQAAIDLINSYTQKNNISFDSLNDITQLLARQDFADKVNGGFDQFYQKIKTASSDNDKHIGYSGIMQWANKLYLSFAQVYMHDYLGGEVLADQWQDFTQAIQAEEQNIQAPASLYT